MLSGLAYGDRLDLVEEGFKKLVISISLVRKRIPELFAINRKVLGAYCVYTFRFNSLFIFTCFHFTLFVLKL